LLALNEHQIFYDVFSNPYSFFKNDSLAFIWAWCWYNSVAVPLFHFIFSLQIARRRTISQGHNYHAVGRSKNIVIASEALSPIELRSPHDAANLVTFSSSRIFGQTTFNLGAICLWKLV